MELRVISRKHGKSLLTKPNLRDKTGSDPDASRSRKFKRNQTEDNERNERAENESDLKKDRHERTESGREPETFSKEEESKASEEDREERKGRKEEKRQEKSPKKALTDDKESTRSTTKDSARKTKSVVSRVSEKLNPMMTKIAFADPSDDYTFSKRLNYCPHVVLMLVILLGTVCILGSVGSSHWMEADVSGLTVHYGLFERCVTTTNDVTTCDAFDWPGWLYGDRSQDRMSGVKTLAIFAIFLASMLIVGLLLLLVTAQCLCCQGWRRRASVVLVDVCFWLMVSSAGVSSLLFLTGVDGLQAYPGSSLLWPPVLYCAGWSLALVSRLVIAACCDVHRRAESGLPFV